MKLRLVVGLVAVVAAAMATSGSVQAQAKRPLVAVMDFEFGTIENWWGQYDIGKGMADQVVDALVNDGTFSVIEGIGLGAKKGKALVNLTARVIDVTSGEIVASVKGEGVSNKGGGFSFDKGGFGVGTNSEEWRNSGIGDAQEQACNSFVAQLVTKKDRLE